MFEDIKEIAKKIIKSRLFMLSLILLILFVVLVQRLFSLQIIHGQEYADNYTLNVERETSTVGTRGNIYDRNGKLLAYNELSNSVTIEDSGYYSSDRSKNARLNTELAEIIRIIEGNGDALANDFSIQLNADGEYEFTVSGTALTRFRADVYGYSKTEDLKKNKHKLGYEESEATAQQMIDFLRSDKKFGIRLEGTDTLSDIDKRVGQQLYSREMAYKILVIRYSINLNSYKRYITTTIATGVSDKTVASIKENSDHLTGVAIAEDTIRVYVDSEYFSHIIGYTGKISQEEYDELSKGNEDYTLTDVIGKSGIEQSMETTLQGTKGYQKFYVDSVGRVTEVIESTESKSGNDVYLSIDSDLQKVVYNLLEQEIAGIVYSKIENIKEYYSDGKTASDIKIPIDDVYFALINNNVIDISHFTKDNASGTEREVYQTFLSKQATVLSELRSQMSSGSPTAYGALDDEQKVYMSYVLTMLTNTGILNKDSIVKDSEVYRNWNREKISLAEYLRYAISQEWIDITGFETNSKYSDTMEIYEALLDYIEEQLNTDKTFSKKLYKYMIRDNQIRGRQLCLILFDQQVLASNESDYAALSSGAKDAYSFLKEKIKNLEITPAQLALDPCSGSCVIVNPQTGELLACVTYPGYDTNRLANTMDADYYNLLHDDLSSPFYNNATQQKTAPGSTFKPVTATAALTEGYISTGTTIVDKGVFELVENGPKCWIWPSGTHGQINVSQAIRDSCNYFFYTLGYNMSLSGETYQEQKGIEILTKYAQLYGLGEKTGIEIAESTSNISDEYPITSAIGQGNHSFTTIALARYTAAVANSGNVYQLTLLDKVTDSQGNVIEDHGPQLLRSMDTVSSSSWNAIHSGMRMVVENHKAFRSFPESVAVAGKTGTAQIVKTRPNHALFIGYAPYDNPTIALTTRIAYGYTSANAAEVSRLILEYCFGFATADQLLTGQALDVGGDNTNRFTD